LIGPANAVAAHDLKFHPPAYPFPPLPPIPLACGVSFSEQGSPQSPVRDGPSRPRSVAWYFSQKHYGTTVVGRRFGPNKKQEVCPAFLSCRITSALTRWPTDSQKDEVAKDTPDNYLTNHKGTAVSFQGVATSKCRKTSHSQPHFGAARREWPSRVPWTATV
jgi:hypothetical protein